MITWDLITTIAVTSIITNVFSTITQIFMYKFLFKNLASLGGSRNGAGSTDRKDEPPRKEKVHIDDWPTTEK